MDAIARKGSESVSGVFPEFSEISSQGGLLNLPSGPVRSHACSNDLGIINPDPSFCDSFVSCPFGCHFYPRFSPCEKGIWGVKKCSFDEKGMRRKLKTRERGLFRARKAQKRAKQTEIALLGANPHALGQKAWKGGSRKNRCSTTLTLSNCFGINFRGKGSPGRA